MPALARNRLLWIIAVLRIALKRSSERFRVQTVSGTLDWPFKERQRWVETEIRTDFSAVINDWDIGQKLGKTTESGQEMLYETYLFEWTWEWGYLYGYFSPTLVTTREHLLKEDVMSRWAGQPILWRSNETPQGIHWYRQIPLLARWRSVASIHGIQITSIRGFLSYVLDDCSGNQLPKLDLDSYYEFLLVWRGRIILTEVNLCLDLIFPSDFETFKCYHHFRTYWMTENAHTVSFRSIDSDQRICSGKENIDL